MCSISKTIGIPALALLSSGPALAGPCVTAPLETYIENRDCFLEDKQFGGWDLSGVRSAGATIILARDITVTPLDTRFNPGFRFDANWNVFNEQAITSEIRFVVLRNPFVFDEDFGKIKDNSLSIAGHIVTGDGTIKVEELKCIGITFNDNFRNLCEDESTPRKLGVDPLSPNARMDFSPADFVAVALKITVDSGVTGTSMLQSVEVRFSEIQRIPEPATAALLALGAAAAAMNRRFRPGVQSPRKQGQRGWLLC